MAMLNVQRVITPTVGKPESWFMFSTCRLLMLYICVKFGESISDGIRVMDNLHEIIIKSCFMRISKKGHSFGTC